MTGAIEEFGPTAVGLKTIVTDAHETSWKDVKKESTHEMGRIDREESAPIAVSAIAIGKGHPSGFKLSEPFVANGDPVGVAAEILKHLCGAGHGRLAIDDPFAGQSLAELLA
jgi:hypothetical protein